jgi:hypothetical protein
VDDPDLLVAAVAFANTAMGEGAPAIAATGGVVEDETGALCFVDIKHENGFTMVAPVHATGEELERQTAYLHLVRTHLDTAKACPN